MISSVACCECHRMDLKHCLLRLLLILGSLARIANGQNLCGFQNCGTLYRNHHVKFTHITNLQEHPWIGRVGYETDRGIVYTCLAVLISRQHLLAPAFCFLDHLIEKTPARYVLLGDWNPRNAFLETDCDFNDYCNPQPQLMEIDEIIVHANYSHVVKRNNISIIKLVQPINFTAHIRPICLQHQDTNYIGQYLPFTGFALNNTIGFKLKGLVQILGAEQCYMTFLNYNLFQRQVPTNYLCGVTNLNPPLIMGSPLMGVHVEEGEPKSYYLIGLLVNQSEDQTQIFTTIQPYREWIERECRNVEKVLI